MGRLDKDHRDMVVDAFMRTIEGTDGRFHLSPKGRRKLDLKTREVEQLIPYYFGHPEGGIRAYPVGTMRAMKRAAMADRTPAEVEAVIEDVIPEPAPIPPAEPVKEKPRRRRSRAQ